MKISHTLLASALLLAAGLSPAMAQGARLTDADVLAGCGNEVRAFNQNIIDGYHRSIATSTKLRDTYRQRTDNALAQNQADQNQALIDKWQAELADITTNPNTSPHGYLHWGGNAAVDNFNGLSAADLRRNIASDRKNIGTDDQAAIRVCVASLRLAQLDGQSSAGRAAPQPAPQPARMPAPVQQQQAQLGGGAAMGAKSVVADTQPVSECVAPHAAGEKGNYGKLENKCGFDIAVRFCNEKTKDGSWEATLACTGSANWGGVTGIAAHDMSSDHVGGQVYWFACRKPSEVSEARYVPGKGITAHCR